jgi:hypothetical protein
MTTNKEKIAEVLWEFDKKWDNYEFSCNGEDHYDGQERETIKDWLTTTLTKLLEERDERLIAGVKTSIERALASKDYKAHAVLEDVLALIKNTN